MRALGVDVGASRKGLDVVVLDDDLRVVDTARRVSTPELEPLIARSTPDVVAIDSPPALGSGHGSRATERELRRFGIQSYGTPSDEKKASSPFFDWMRVGFEAFAVAERSGYPRYRAGSARGKSVEVFPHASAVVLAGCLPPPGTPKREWRASILRTLGVEVDRLRSADQVDAALAAVTGLFALRGRSFAPGDPKEGVIVLPARSLPPPPYRRCSKRVPVGAAQQHLPGLSACACGDPACVALTGSEFARGHDAKRKSTLWKLARTGQEATEELRRRGWELPPEMR